MRVQPSLATPTLAAESQTEWPWQEQSLPPMMGILFDVTAKKRVWVLQTKTYVWDNRTDEVKPAVDLVVEHLRADKIIP